MPRHPLPSSLGTAFSTRAALAAGVPRSRLRADDLVHPYHGVRALAGLENLERRAEEVMIERVHHYAQRMTAHEFFTHVTAAVIWGLPVPYWAVESRPLDVGVFAPRRNAAGRGVRGHSVAPGYADTVNHPEFGVPVTSPASTWALLGGVLRDPYDLVAVADAVIRVPMHPDEPPPLATLADLEAALAAGRRVGAPRLRDALPRVDERSASRPETWLRLLLIDAGLGVPSANFDVEVRGRWIARVDLAFARLRVAIEYEGEHHLVDAEQWARDIRRTDALIEAGWRVIRVTRDDVFAHPTALVLRVRRALAAASR